MIDSMGVSYIPFTFPTVTVRNAMRLSVPDITSAQVDRIWELYKSAALKDQVPVYTKDLGGAGIAKILNYMSEQGIAKNTMAAWLNATLAATDTFGFRWIDPVTSKKATDEVIANVKGAVTSTAETVGDSIGFLTKPLTDNLKWLAIGAIVLGGAYIAYESGVFKKGSRK